MFKLCASKGLIGIPLNAASPIFASSLVRLLALDMDGTLLDSSSEVLSSSVHAINEALSKGVQVILATGKARPAAMAAMERVGLAGEGLVVGDKSAGIFLQGLCVHGPGGSIIAGGELEKDVLKMVMEYAVSEKISACGFLGETCVTPEMTDEVHLLHSRYYEPLADVVSNVDDIFLGPPVRKVLLMADALKIKNEIRPLWEDALANTSASPMQAVDTMLEIVPRGWNKWTGMQALLNHSLIYPEEVMAIGDGENDLEMIAGVGLGIAMGNAVPAVKEVALEVVANNDEDGIAEAINKYVL